MNLNVSDSLHLANNIKEELEGYTDPTTEIIVCPSFLSVYPVSEILKNSIVKTGAQNMSSENDGAFTGEVSGSMIKSAGCSYVILGHSERRQYFSETDSTICKKISKALENYLTPIVCVGEKEDERESGKYEEVVNEQIVNCLNNFSKDNLAKIVIAYEPVWAIGTGRTATPQQANEMHSFIREVIGKKFDNNTASNIQILYGGSMNDKNSAELLSQSDIDGGLIGGASLNAKSFINIIKSIN